MIEDMVIIRAVHDTDVRALAPDLLRCQHAAYAVEARIIGDNRIPPLHEDERDLLAAGLSWIVAFEGTRPIGAIGYTIEDEIVDVDRLIVDPDHQRRGVGTELVARVIDLASRVVVSTASLNTPARLFYEGLGFTHQGDAEPLPGLWISRYSRS